MHRIIVALTTGAAFAFAALISAPQAGAGESERCVCTSTIPVPPVPPVPPVAPLPPMPRHSDSGRHHVVTKIVIVGPDGKQRVHRIRNVVRLASHDSGRMTRDEFINRAGRAFDEHDENHDGVLDGDERDDMSDPGDDVDVDDVEMPEPPEAPEPPDVDEAPEPPQPPHPPQAPRAPKHH